MVGTMPGTMPVLKKQLPCLFQSCQARHTPERRSHAAAGKESTGERWGPERVRRSFILCSVHSVGQLCAFL